MSFDQPVVLPPGGDLPVVLLATMMLLVPAVGVPSDLMVQDTLKSMLVSFSALGAALLLCWHGHRKLLTLRWHPILCLPLMFMVWALGSMAWSHAYLAGVESVRWFVFAVLVWVGLSTLTLDRLSILATGIHWGAVMASLWAALQFWLDFQLFPQVARPAATFLNRNFFAEFVVCVLPFSVMLAAQARGRGPILLRVFTASFLMLTLLMTGTRSALLAWLVLVPVLLFVLWRYRERFSWITWSRTNRRLALGVVFGTLLGLGTLQSGSPAVEAEGIGKTVLERAFFRGQSLLAPAEYATSEHETAEYASGSSGVRLRMWRATMRLIMDRPLSGVGAGAWEVKIPLYLDSRAQDEIDYYVHNEYLQLLAEYGVVGWLFALGLSAYLLRAAYRTWLERAEVFAGSALEAPWRAMLLSSLLALMIVSGAGFPWRLAGTGALFALALGALAASDLRLQSRVRKSASGGLGPNPMIPRGLMVGFSLCTILAMWISWQAAMAEYQLVRAGRLSYRLLTIPPSDDLRWRQTRDEIMRLARQGIAIHPHYRKITPIIAANLAAVGDWTHAKWIWESIHNSRPHVVAILANLSRASVYAGDLPQAQRYFEKAQAISINAPATRTVEVMLLIRQGKVAQAKAQSRRYLYSAGVEPELVYYAYTLGMQEKDWALALESQELRRRLWPATAPDSWLKTGFVHLAPEVNNPLRARMAFQAALDSAPDELKTRVRDLMPMAYRAQMRHELTEAERPQ